MAVKDQVLALMKHTAAVYSGEKLAQALNVSRTAVWKAVRELEKEGWRFEHTASGYRYLPSDVLDAAEILAMPSPFPDSGAAIKADQSFAQADAPAPDFQVAADDLKIPAASASAAVSEAGTTAGSAADPLLFGELPVDLAVEITETSESTMLEAKKAVADGRSAPRLFITETQTGGHGRFGRPFFSPKGQGIYMTLLLNPNHRFDDLPQYTLLAAVAVCDAIAALTGKECEIKWVNDIYLEGRKVVGILSEATSDIESGTISHISIGMGINFSTPQTDFPQELQSKATSLFADGNRPPITRNQLIRAIWQRFFTLLAGLPEDTAYLEDYRRRSFVLGQTVSFRRQGAVISGTAVAITDEGQLVVRTPEETVTLNSGEISLESIGERKLR